MIIPLLKNHSYKLTLAWALLIFGLCAMPGKFIPSVSWLELLSFDKWVHAGIFFVLVGLFCISVKAHQQNIILFYFFFVLSLVYGGVLEFMQAKIFSHRSADWYDVMANSFGCLMALLFGKKINKLVFK